MFELIAVVCVATTAGEVCVATPPYPEPFKTEAGCRQALPEIQASAHMHLLELGVPVLSFAADCQPVEVGA